MPVTGVAIEGANELVAALKRAGGPELTAGITRANRAAADVVVDVATPITPRRHGDLVHSLKALASTRSGRVRAGSGTVPYAAAIHWGRKIGNVGRPAGNHKGPNPIKGNPFLYNALSASVYRVTQAYRVEIDATLEKAIGEG